MSSAGYAIGYFGGGMLLAINLLMIQKPSVFGIPDAGTAVRLSLASVGIWWLAVLDSALSQGARAAAQNRQGRSAWRQRRRDRVPPADRDVQGAEALQAGVPAAARLPDLQRRHPDDHQDGDDLRQRDQHRSERDDHRAPDHAVHRRAVRVPVRHGRGPDRREGLGLCRARRLRVHHPAGVLHDERGALLRARDHGGHGPGRHAGAQPLDVREHDPAGTSHRSSLRSSASSSATPAFSGR